MNKLNNITKKLKEDYGDRLSIQYIVTGIEEEDESSILQCNQMYEKLGVGFLLEDLITLDVTFSVKSGNKTTRLDKEFFFPSIRLIKIDGKWIWEAIKGFPSPASEDVISLFGVKQ